MNSFLYGTMSQNHNTHRLRSNLILVPKVLKESAEFMVSQGAIEAAPELEIYNGALYNAAVNTASEIAAK